VQDAEAKAEAELQALADSRLALVDRGFMSDDSENEGDDAVLDDILALSTGPTSFAATRFASQAEGLAVAEMERLRAGEQAEADRMRSEKAERRRKREVKKAQRERSARGERQPGTY
jgi:hypothetical protein